MEIKVRKKCSRKKGISLIQQIISMSFLILIFFLFNFFINYILDIDKKIMNYIDILNMYVFVDKLKLKISESEIINVENNKIYLYDNENNIVVIYQNENYIVSENRKKDIDISKKKNKIVKIDSFSIKQIDNLIYIDLFLNDKKVNIIVRRGI